MSGKKPAGQLKFPELSEVRKLIVVAFNEEQLREQVATQKSNGSWAGPVYVSEHYPCILVGYEIRQGIKRTLTNRIILSADFRDGRRLPLCITTDDPLPGHSPYKGEWLLRRMEQHVRQFALARIAQ